MSHLEFFMYMASRTWGWGLIPFILILPLKAVTYWVRYGFLGSNRHLNPTVILTVNGFMLIIHGLGWIFDPIKMSKCLQGLGCYADVLWWWWWWHYKERPQNGYRTSAVLYIKYEIAKLYVFIYFKKLYFHNIIYCIGYTFYKTIAWWVVKA